MRTDTGLSIVVTAVGAVLPTGRGRERLWSAWLDGKPALSPYRNPNVSTRRALHFGHFVEESVGEAWAALPHRLRRCALDYAACSVLAVKDALAQAGESWQAIPEERRSIYTAQSDSTCPSISHFSRALEQAQTPGGTDMTRMTRVALTHGGLDPFVTIKGLSNNTLALNSIAHRFRGDCAAFVQAEGAALAAIRQASMSLRHHYADMALVIGSGSYDEPVVLAEHQQLGHLSPCSDGNRSLRSFDEQRDGTILSEGAVALVLERAEDARARGARALCRIGGVMSSVHRNASRVAVAELAARLFGLLDKRGCEPGDLAAVSADGKGTLRDDANEIALMEAVLGDCKVPVTTLRPITGALDAAGPLADLAALAVALEQSVLPPVANLKCPASGQLEFVLDTPRPLNGDAALSLHSSFNGFCGAVLLERAS